MTGALLHDIGKVLMKKTTAGGVKGDRGSGKE